MGMDRFLVVRESTLMELIDLVARVVDQTPSGGLKEALRGAMSEVLVETTELVSS